MRKIDRKNNRKINCETSREINHEINYEVNRETLTYRELKAMVPATPKGKMPRADKLTGEIQGNQFWNVNIDEQ